METNTQHYTKTLKGYLDALDAHDKEQRRLLDDPDTTWTHELSMTRRNEREEIVANIIVAARTLVSLPLEAPASSECAACRDLGEVIP